MTVLITAIASGCTYSDREPGLFSAPRTQPSATQSPGAPRSTPPEATNPELPVAGEAVWTTADGLGVIVRFAVHAVRRIPGATVLDWSVTPLGAPHLEFGDPITTPVDLGLTTSSGSDVDVTLFDATGQLGYAPLRHRSAQVFNHCLCTPLWVVQQQLRIGETRLLQIAYPELPTSTTHVDVALANFAPITHVPVTPIGMAPAPLAAVDLARTVTPSPPAASVTVAVDASDTRRAELRINRIVATEGSSSMEWSITSLTDQSQTFQTGFGSPLSRPISDSFQLINLSPANGPQLMVNGKSTGVSWLQVDAYGFRAYDCRCSELGLWSKSVTRSGGSAELVSTYPALPLGTTAVGVSLPGNGVIAKVPVLRSDDAARRLAPPTVRRTSMWRYSVDDPPHGWRTADWPTDVPDATQLGDYVGSAEPIVSLN